MRYKIISIFVTLGLMGCDQVAQEVESPADFHDGLLTLDSHVDIAVEYTLTDALDPGKQTDMQVDLHKMKKGGLDGAFFIVYVGQTERTEENYAKAKAAALHKFKMIHRMTDDLYPDRIGLAYHPEEVAPIYESGRNVAMIGIENGYVIGKDLSLVEDYYKRGARYMTLAHNGHNDICDSAQPKAEFGDEAEEHGGLSDFGRDVIDEMNRVGMMVDISHVSDAAMMQAVQYSKAPVIASHSSVRSLAAHARNLTDDQMRALAKAGGVMQMVAYTGYVKFDPQRGKAVDRLMDEVAKKYGAEKFDRGQHGDKDEFVAGQAAIEKEYPMGTVQQFVDHIDYAVKIMGIDHVGISSDFGGGGGISGWNSALETINVTKELLARGYSKEDIAKIWSGNLIRVWQDVEKVAGL